MLQPRYLQDCGAEDAFDVKLLPGGDRDMPPSGEEKLLFAPTIRLCSGQDMPILGFGTHELRGYNCCTAIHKAIETGFRHFDTAFRYENEREVGNAIRTQIAMGNVSRENIFLVDKLWNTHHDPREVRRICCKQLSLLGMEYIDLYLMHFPVAYKFYSDDVLEPREDGVLQLTDTDYVDTWRAMERLVSEGLVKSIGVSNFNVEQIQRLIANCQIKPVVNQVEFWPGFMQKDMLDFCRYNGIVVTAYAPLGQPNREEHTPIYFFSVKMKQICKQYCKKPAQIVLRYLIDAGVVPIPKAANHKHISENLNIFDFKLNGETTAAIRGIKPKRRLVQYEEVKAQKHPFYPFELDSEEEEPPTEVAKMPLTPDEVEDEGDEEQEEIPEVPPPPPPEATEEPPPQPTVAPPPAPEEEAV